MIKNECRLYEYKKKTLPCELSSWLLNLSDPEYYKAEASDFII